MPKKTNKAEVDDLLFDVVDVCRAALGDMMETREWNAGVINAARQVCKDNGVAIDPEKADPLGDLASILPFDEKDRMAK